MAKKSSDYELNLPIYLKGVSITQVGVLTTYISVTYNSGQQHESPNQFKFAPGVHQLWCIVQGRLAPDDLLRCRNAWNLICVLYFIITLAMIVVTGCLAIVN